MLTLVNILVAFVAVIHFYFLILEMFLWTKPLGLKVFGQSLVKAKDSAVLAANQGLYNGFLSAGLVWGLVYPDLIVPTHIKIFFLICVIVAGLYGGFTANKRILFVQALPAVLALALVLLSRYLNSNTLS